jgi:very-short-patch-repair endonuclease
VSYSLRAIDATAITERGWKPGTDLENRVTRFLAGAFTTADLKQEHRVGRYRLDYAWPDVMVGLEVDGWHHRSPEGAAHDAQRDAWLRGQGWLVLRVDDRNGLDAMAEAIVRVCRVVHGLRAIDEPQMIRYSERHKITGGGSGAA